MSLVDKIEQLGAMAEIGALSKEDAAHQLQQFSDGGLTLIGARSAVESWRTVRADYQRSLDSTRERLARYRGGEA